jgi:hypothetical protein
MTFAAVTTYNHDGEESSRRIINMKNIRYKMVSVSWTPEPMLLITLKDGSSFYVKGDLDSLVATWQDQIH